MKTIFIVFSAWVISISAYAQNTFKAIIKDSETKESLLGATAVVQGTTNGSVANEEGLVTITNIPDGKQVILFRFVGYEERRDTFNFPLADDSVIEILLVSNNEELEEVEITSTRSNRTISDIPTRVEAITGEELDEKATMKPGEIKMLLSESTGIQTQQTSASSGNQTIRIQGLDGRYTQLLKDGFPLYSGFAGGLSIMQIPPLDLKQVEVIKGSASTLYGGGAIAGLINMISKTPGEEKELSLMLNGTSALGFDASTFYSQRFEKTGITVFGSYNLSNPYDPAKNGFSALPKYNRYTLNPKLFFYPNKTTTIVFGVNSSYENRLGGDMLYIRGEGDSIHSYFERNISQRISSQFSFNKKFGETKNLSFKNSVGYFNRVIEQPSYTFSGGQVASFSELVFSTNTEMVDWVFGANLWTDDFKESNTIFQKRDYTSTVTGAFVQNTFVANKFLTIESGLRGDYAMMNEKNNSASNEFVLLPRASFLFKISPKWSSRLGGGLGYKTPTIFTEQAESQAFQNVQPINFETVKTERSYGGNFDVNYRTAIGENWTFSINQLFFYTRLDKPLAFNADSLIVGQYYFQNANGYLDTKGSETNMKIGFKDFKLYVGYTYTDAQSHYNDTISTLTLTAKNRLNIILMYEAEEKWRVGYELFYIGKQNLTGNQVAPDYWVMGISLERRWEHIRAFVNFENFTDTRQTKFESIYTGTVTNPQFRQIYAPLEGFIFNGGIKIIL
jgi:outer membrane receptor for ferrienterochelin and colicins